jgi:hypothetical protein
MVICGCSRELSSPGNGSELVAPKEIVAKGQPLVIVRLDDGRMTEVKSPRAGHRVVTRRSIGSRVDDSSVLV